MTKEKLQKQFIKSLVQNPTEGMYMNTFVAKAIIVENSDIFLSAERDRMCKDLAVAFSEQRDVGGAVKAVAMIEDKSLIFYTIDQIRIYQGSEGKVALNNGCSKMAVELGKKDLVEKAMIFVKNIDDKNLAISTVGDLVKEQFDEKHNPSGKDERMVEISTEVSRTVLNLIEKEDLSTAIRFVFALALKGTKGVADENKYAKVALDMALSNSEAMLSSKDMDTINGAYAQLVSKP